MIYAARRGLWSSRPEPWQFKFAADWSQEMLKIIREPHGDAVLLPRGPDDGNSARGVLLDEEASGRWVLSFPESMHPYWGGDDGIFCVPRPRTARDIEHKQQHIHMCGRHRVRADINTPETTHLLHTIVIAPSNRDSQSETIVFSAIALGAEQVSSNNERNQKISFPPVTQEFLIGFCGLHRGSRL